MFGDKDVYEPDEAYADFETEDIDEAYEWFDSYTGFDDDDDIYSASRPYKNRRTAVDDSIPEIRITDWDENNTRIVITIEVLSSHEKRKLTFTYGDMLDGIFDDDHSAMVNEIYRYLDDMNEGVI